LIRQLLSLSAASLVLTAATAGPGVTHVDGLALVTALFERPAPEALVTGNLQSAAPFAIVYVYALNDGDRPVAVPVANFRAVSPSGQSFAPEPTQLCCNLAPAAARFAPFKGGELRPGEQEEGVIAFRIPGTDARAVTLDVAWRVQFTAPATGHAVTMTPTRFRPLPAAPPRQR